MYKDSFYFHEKDKPIIRKYDIQQEKFTDYLTVPYLNTTNPKNRLYTTKLVNYPYILIKFNYIGIKSKEIGTVVFFFMNI